MELVLQKMHINKRVCQTGIQTTLEEDKNVPDYQPDIEHIIKLQGNTEKPDFTVEDDKVLVKGILHYSVLYQCVDDIQPIHNLTGQIPFEETLYMDNIAPSDDLNCQITLDDCQISLINSRKFSIHALISIHCCQTAENELSAGTNIIMEEAARAEFDDYAVPDGLQQKHQDITYTKLSMQKKDILRLKEEYLLPKGKSGIDTLLYSEITPQNIQTKVTDDGIRFTGDLKLFLLYTSEENERSLEYLESEIPFDEIVTCNGCNESMIPDIEILIGSKQLEIKNNDAGENRIVDIELILKLHIKFFEDITLNILEDAYSTNCQIILERDYAMCEKLTLRNQSSTRISEHIPLNTRDNRILQICSVSGNIQIDEENIINDGISIEGAVSVDILCITENDDTPIITAKGIIPFQHVIEAKGILPNDTFELRSEISQINVMLIDSQEAEIKVVLSLSALIFRPKEYEIITSITEHPLDLEQLQQMPGMVGLIAEQDFSLWDIAKKYNTTPEIIKSLNHLDAENIKKGEKLLILKSVEGL